MSNSRDERTKQMTEMVDSLLGGTDFDLTSFKHIAIKGAEELHQNAQWQANTVCTCELTQEELATMREVFAELTVDAAGNYKHFFICNIVLTTKIFDEEYGSVAMVLGYSVDDFDWELFINAANKMVESIAGRIFDRYVAPMVHKNDGELH